MEALSFPSSGLPMCLSLNNSCFPVKHSKLVRSEQVLGLLISNLLHKFSLMNFNVKASEELKQPQAPTNGDSWVFFAGSPVLWGRFLPSVRSRLGPRCPVWPCPVPEGFSWCPSCTKHHPELPGPTLEG